MGDDAGRPDALTRSNPAKDERARQETGGPFFDRGFAVRGFAVLRPARRSAELEGGFAARRAVARSAKAGYHRLMQYRTFGRVAWPVSEVGYGMWGMAGWTGSADEESFAALDRAIELGCNFFDTAWAYGDGHSERLLGQTLKRHRGKRLYVATKIPPKNRKWPARPYKLDDVFPADYIREYTEKSLENIGVQTLDLQQLHVWNDDWAGDDRWQRAVSSLKEEKLVSAIGISVNRFQPANVLRALDTGLIDAVQVVYNTFDQSPEDELFPDLPGEEHRHNRKGAVRRRQPDRQHDRRDEMA